MSLTDHVDGIVHAETQAADGGLDLSLAGVREVTGPGQVDFGGGELAPAETADVATEKRDPADDYGWWHLDGGTYLLAYNERLVGDADLLLQPRDAIVERGASHPTLRVDDGLPAVPLTVPDAGLHLKENARVSTLRRA